MQHLVIVGNSLFTESVSHMLAESDEIEIVAVVPTIEQALVSMSALAPDVVIMVDNGARNSPPALLLATLCDATLVYITMQHGYLQVVTSQCMLATKSHLFAAIAASKIGCRTSSGVAPAGGA